MSGTKQRSSGLPGATRPGRPPASERGEVDARLLEAARSVFIERGYAGATIDMIVRRAQASKRSIYSRFRDKAALFEAAVADAIDRWFRPAEAFARDAALDGSLSVRERLLRIGEGFREAATNPVSIALDAVIASQSAAFPLLAARLQAEGHARAVAIVRDVLEQAGGTRVEPAAEAFYALLVVAPMRTDQVAGVVAPIDCGSVVDFVLAGAELPPV